KQNTYVSPQCFGFLVANAEIIGELMERFAGLPVFADDPLGWIQLLQLLGQAVQELMFFGEVTRIFTFFTRMLAGPDNERVRFLALVDFSPLVGKRTTVLCAAPLTPYEIEKTRVQDLE